MSVTLIDHPLAQHKVGLLRSNLKTQAFRAIANELCLLLAYEASKDLPLESYTIEGWAGPVTGKRIAGKMLSAVPILRAGIGMLDGFLELIPGAKVSTVGIFRNEETLTPVSYYTKLAKDIHERKAFILDPMLATGGSAIATVDLLKNAGCKDIRALFIVAAPQGLNALEKAHPDVAIFTCAIDEKLNDDGYIIPGLGDAGDRIFGTK